jgi:hypothetical protein
MGRQESVEDQACRSSRTVTRCLAPARAGRLGVDRRRGPRLDGRPCRCGRKLAPHQVPEAGSYGSPGAFGRPPSSQAGRPRSARGVPGGRRRPLGHRGPAEQHDLQVHGWLGRGAEDRVKQRHDGRDSGRLLSGWRWHERILHSPDDRGRGRHLSRPAGRPERVAARRRLWRSRGQLQSRFGPLSTEHRFSSVAIAILSQCGGPPRSSRLTWVIMCFLRSRFAGIVAFATSYG